MQWLSITSANFALSVRAVAEWALRCNECLFSVLTDVVGVEYLDTWEVWSDANHFPLVKSYYTVCRVWTGKGSLNLLLCFDWSAYQSSNSVCCWAGHTYSIKIEANFYCHRKSSWHCIFIFFCEFWSPSHSILSGYCTST